MSREPHRRAFMLPDLMIAIVIGSALIIALTMAVGRLKVADRQLQETRATVRRLEAGLFALGQGEKPEAAIRVERLDTVAPAGRVWVRVRLGDAGARQSLVGLVPVRAVEGAATAPNTPAGGGP